MALFAKKGYGQVEPNRLSAQKGGLIPSQLPYGVLDDSDNYIAGSTLENGHFCVYNEAIGWAVDANTSSDVADSIMLVFCEEKRYDERDASRSTFKLDASKAINGKIYPRLLPMQVGDAYTTNYLDISSYTGDNIVKQYLTIVDGIPKWVLSKPNTGFTLQVVKNTTLPDGQVGFKLMRVQ